MDVRAAAQAQRIFASGDPALRYCLAGANAEWMPPKMLWLKEHEPERYAATATLLEFTDWIAYRLTGTAHAESGHRDAALVLPHTKRRLAAGFLRRDRAARPGRQVSGRHSAVGRNHRRR
jgi:ribulose kinase